MLGACAPCQIERTQCDCRHPRSRSRCSYCHRRRRRVRMIVLVDVVMEVLRVRLGLLIFITCGIVFMSWKMDVLRFTNNAFDSSKAAWKTKTLIGVQTLDSKTLANRKHDNGLTLANRIHDGNFESAFPFDEYDDENINEESYNDNGAELRNGHDIGNNKDPANPKMKTFFTSMKVSFISVQIGPDKSIPTLRFLGACLATVQLFENMNRRILGRVVSDIRGNVEKIQSNYDALPNESLTLQSMVLRDVKQLSLGDDPDYYAKSSMLALRWLVRAFRFISRFLTHINEGKDQIPSAQIAYEETLKQHHGYVVRTLFRAAFLSLSTRADFLKELSVNETDIDRSDFEEIAMADLREYNIALNERLKIIEEFFKQHEIEV